MKFISLLLLLLTANYAAAASNPVTCAAFSKTLADSKFKDSSRKLTAIETLTIKTIDAEIYNLLEKEELTVVFDVDNDGKEDLILTVIDGSGRYVFADIYELPTPQSSQITKKFSAWFGLLIPPRYITIQGHNYVIVAEDGISEEPTVYQLFKTSNEKYLKQKLCSTKIRLSVSSKCQHIACKNLSKRIKNRKENQLFTYFEWPHKYFPPAGLAIYYSPNDSYGDFDNTKLPIAIWRLGRKEYVSGYVYWHALGLGEQEPENMLPITSDFPRVSVRKVLPGDEHARLKRTLFQQSAVLSAQLKQKIDLPEQGEFFLFSINDQTYWAWDFEPQPFGENIHISYTNAFKSDYIGMIQIKRKPVLVPCADQCTNFPDK